MFAALLKDDKRLIFAKFKRLIDAAYRKLCRRNSGDRR
jgi:hypothetical protein